MMNRVIFGVTVVFAAYILAGHALTCNNCPVGLAGLCIFSTEETCAANSSCFTGKATFNISSFLGFNSQGCLPTSDCNTTVAGTILGAGFSVSKTCCDTDKCNPVQISGATSAKLPLSLALAAAFGASVWSGLAF